MWLLYLLLLVLPSALGQWQRNNEADKVTFLKEKSVFKYDFSTVCENSQDPNLQNLDEYVSYYLGNSSYRVVTGINDFETCYYQCGYDNRCGNFAFAESCELGYKMEEGMEMLNATQKSVFVNMNLFVEYLNDLLGPCSTDPCEYEGTCTRTGCHFECDCPDYRTGERCEVDVDECASEPCINSGACEDSINSYICNCANGYIGQHCEVDVNECASNPCMNQGLCQNRINSYRCACANGYTGQRCEIDVNECESNPCMHGGSCQNRINSYRCNCATYYTGRRCENVDTRQLNEAICENGQMPVVDVLTSSVHTNRMQETLCLEQTEGAWYASTNSLGEWVEVDMLTTRTVVQVVSRGTGRSNYVKKFDLFYKRYNDNVPIGEFMANIDTATPKVNTLPQPINTQIMRIEPLEWHGSIPSMRIGIMVVSQ